MESTNQGPPRRRDGQGPDGRRDVTRGRTDPRDVRAWSAHPVYVSPRGGPVRLSAPPSRIKPEISVPLENLTALANPVRHEANNLLAAISGTVDILLRTAATDRDRARAERLREATDRLEALLKAYLSLAAPPAAEDGIDVVQMLTLMRPLLVLSLGPGRPVEIDAPPGLPRVSAAPAQLQAGMLRLAREAVAMAPPGAVLRFSLSPIEGGVAFGVSPIPDGPAPAPIILPTTGG